MAETNAEINLKKEVAQTDGSENIQIENKTYSREEVAEMAEEMWESHIDSHPSLKKIVKRIEELDEGSKLALLLLKRGHFDRAIVEGAGPYVTVAANEVLPSLNNRIDELMQVGREDL